MTVPLFSANETSTSTLLRIAEAGGQPQIIATGLPDISELGYHASAAAIDADGKVYFAQKFGRKKGFEVVRVDAAAGPTTIAECTELDECPQPAWIQVHGDEIMLGRMGASVNVWNGFLRLPKTPSAPLTPAGLAKATVELAGDSIGAGWFEGDRFLVAYRRAYSVEGVVSSRLLPPLLP